LQQVSVSKGQHQVTVNWSKSPHCKSSHVNIFTCYIACHGARECTPALSSCYTYFCVAAFTLCSFVRGFPRSGVCPLYATGCWNIILWIFFFPGKLELKIYKEKKGECGASFNAGKESHFKSSIAITHHLLFRQVTALKLTQEERPGSDLTCGGSGPSVIAAEFKE
jgi:hypothetical protein